MLNTHGRFEAAAAAELVQALADRPQDVALYYTLVQSRHLAAADVPTLIARMRQAQAFTLPAPARLRLHPALARALHQQGAYAEAETELLAADRLRARHTLMNRPALRNLTDQTIASFTPIISPAPATGGICPNVPCWFSACHDPARRC